MWKIPIKLATSHGVLVCECVREKVANNESFPYFLLYATSTTLLWQYDTPAPDCRLMGPGR
jgi:hypothetical protein